MIYKSDSSKFHVGQEVAYGHLLQPYYNFAISVVGRITPTGIIVLEDGKRFSKQGFEHGSKGSSAKLEPLTQALKDRIETSKLKNRLSERKIHRLPLAGLREVAGILEKYEVPE